MRFTLLWDLEGCLVVRIILLLLSLYLDTPCLTLVYLLHNMSSTSSSTSDLKEKGKASPRGHPLTIQTRIEPEELVNLPLRTLSNIADLGEYVGETAGGQILREVKSNKTGRIERWELVTWDIDDPENPKNWSKAYRWWCTMMVAFTCFVVAFNSSVITADLGGPTKEFNVSNEVALLSITLFVVGFGIGECYQTTTWQ